MSQVRWAKQALTEERRKNREKEEAFRRGVADDMRDLTDYLETRSHENGARENNAVQTREELKKPLCQASTSSDVVRSAVTNQEELVPAAQANRRSSASISPVKQRTNSVGKGAVEGKNAESSATPARVEGRRAQRRWGEVVEGEKSEVIEGCSAEVHSAAQTTSPQGSRNQPDSASMTYSAGGGDSMLGSGTASGLRMVRRPAGESSHQLERGGAPQTSSGVGLSDWERGLSRQRRRMSNEATVRDSRAVWGSYLVDDGMSPGRFLAVSQVAYVLRQRGGEITEQTEKAANANARDVVRHLSATWRAQYYEGTMDGSFLKPPSAALRFSCAGALPPRNALGTSLAHGFAGSKEAAFGAGFRLPAKGALASPLDPSEEISHSQPRLLRASALNASSGRNIIYKLENDSL